MSWIVNAKLEGVRRQYGTYSNRNGKLDREQLGRNREKETADEDKASTEASEVVFPNTGKVVELVS